MVLEFHTAFRLPVSPVPTVEVPLELVQLRGDLLDEELDELASAILVRDIVATADALADAVYVLFGTAWTFGIDLDAVLAEVHRSNMSKLGRDGRPILRPDGKVMKGPDYRSPDLLGVLGLSDGVMACSAERHDPQGGRSAPGKDQHFGGSRLLQPRP